MEKHRFGLKCFGTGDGWPCDDRNHSAYLYRLGNATFLIDCGEPISKDFKASGIDYDLIDRIFISHLHFDHVGGFFMLMQGFWLEQRQRDLPVHLPGYGVPPIRQMLDAGCIFDELLPFRLQFTPLQSAEPVAMHDVRVTPFHSTHLESLRQGFQKKYPQPFEAYSFLLESGNLRIVHSADIGDPTDLLPMLTKPVDLLVCELAHFKPEVLFHFLSDKPIKKIVFAHLARRYWENLEEMRALAARCLPNIPITFARDGDEIDLS